MRGHLDRLAKPREATSQSADLVAEAVISQGEGGFSAVVTLRDAERTRTRTLTAQDCGQLGRAVAIVVAVALDPVATAASVLPVPLAAPPEPEALTAPTPTVAAAEPQPPTAIEAPIEDPIDDPIDEPVAPRSPPLPRADRPPPSRASGPFVEAGARFGLGVGGRLLPGAGVGFAAAPFVGFRRLHARLAVQYWAPRDATLTDVSQAGATFQLVSVGVRGCPILATGRWRFPLCAGFDAGAMIGSGRGDALASRTRATDAWTAIVLAPGVELALTPRVDLWAAFEGVFSLNRPRYHLDGGGPLHRAAGFGPRGLVGVAVHRRRPPP